MVSHGSKRVAWVPLFLSGHFLSPANEESFKRYGGYTAILDVVHGLCAYVHCPSRINFDAKLPIPFSMLS
ncbi:hypothetical protein MASR2M8_22680 [Opitutaceae bacterium]